MGEPLGAPVPVAAAGAVALRRLVCDECQQCPMWRRTELKRCAGCRAVYYCTRQDGDGRAACQLEAWSGHKTECKRATAERKRREAASAT